MFDFKPPKPSENLRIKSLGEDLYLVSVKDPKTGRWESVKMRGDKNRIRRDMETRLSLRKETSA